MLRPSGHSGGLVCSTDTCMSLASNIHRTGEHMQLLYSATYRVNNLLVLTTVIVMIIVMILMPIQLVNG